MRIPFVSRIFAKLSILSVTSQTSRRRPAMDGTFLLTTQLKNLLTRHHSIIWSSLHLWPWAITIVESLQRIYSLPVADTVYCRRPPKFYCLLRQIKLFSWWIYQTQLLLLLLLLPTYNFINIWCEVISATKVYFYTGNPQRIYLSPVAATVPC